MFKSFPQISVFDPIFYFLVHYSLILKIAHAIVKTLFLVSMSSNDRDYNKKLYITSLDSLFE